MNRSDLAIEVRALMDAYRLRPRPMSRSHGWAASRGAALGLATAATLVMGTGVGYAFWTSNGTGSGHGAVAPAQQIGFSVLGQSSASLYPGASGDVTVTLTNPYARPLTITGLSGTVSTDKPGCGNDDFTVAANPAGLPASLTANQTVASQSLTAAVSMDSDASNNCQGATVTVAYTIAGTL